MNTLFWRDVRNKNPTTYDALVEMMRSEIVNEKLIDHRNRTSMGLPQPQMQRRGPVSHLVGQQWTQAGHTIAPTSGQALATFTLNVVPSLAYEEVGPDIHRQPNMPRERGRGRRERELRDMPYCTYHRTYGHSTKNCSPRPYHEEPARATVADRNNYRRQTNAHPSR